MRKNTSYDGFPTITTKNWMAVREQFQKAMPRIVTPESLAPCLDIKDPFSINANVIVSLKQMGLLDEVGVPTELAHIWRFDEEYSSVCKTIVERTYPKELLDLSSRADCKRGDVENWFMKRGLGKDSARKMGRVFLMLSDGDLRSKKYRRVSAVSANDKTTPDAPARLIEESSVSDTTPSSRELTYPSVHIDVQLHISPDAPNEQIEAIFANMAKYLYRDA